jgi:hypothetical protein
MLRPDAVLVRESVLSLIRSTGYSCPLIAGIFTKDYGPKSMVEVGSDEEDQSKADKRKDPVKRFEERQVVDKDL